MSGSQHHDFLPYGHQAIDEADIAAVVSVLKGEWLTQGPAVDAFERAFAEATDAREAVSCNNGTSALHLAALDVGVGPGDVVVVPATTFVATANAFRLAGADIVFADVDSQTGLMTPDTLQAALAAAPAARVKAVVAVHLAGQCADMPAIAEIAAAHGILVIEDACHAVGGSYRGRDGSWHKVGSCAHSAAAIFSFHPVKTITMGEGGALTLNDPLRARRIRQWRSHGIERDPERFAYPQRGFAADGVANPWYHEAVDLGCNYRATDIQCALGLSQLAKLDRFTRRRSELVQLYDERLSGLAPGIRPIVRVPYCRPAWHLYPVLIDFERLGLGRGSLMRALRDLGIGTQVHYIPVPSQPYYRRLNPSGRYPGAESYYARTLSLPLFPTMTDGDVDRVANALTAVAGTDAKRYADS
jgi:UDP-4-amino-4,6-dideoxy-N-acetyl-beta-L-altrosamine transaminase